MLLTPPDRGPDAQPHPGRPASADAWLAAPVAEASASLTSPVRPHRAGAADPALDSATAGVSLVGASVRAGGCFARPLPLDETCASAARRFFRESVAGAGLPGDLVYDGVTMASELAANTMNAHGNIEFGGRGHRPVTGMPELWVYLRSCKSGRELVCKIFDSLPGWDAGEPLPVGAAVPAGPDSGRGKGLQMGSCPSPCHWGHPPI